MNNNKITSTVLGFEALVTCYFYLYSLRCDSVPWGSHHNDGLYFLMYYLIVLPAMIILSIVKVFEKERQLFFRLNYFLYAFLISLPAIISLRTQFMLNTGMIISAIIAIVNIFELRWGWIKEKQGTP
jgi:hypothetical protein